MDRASGRLWHHQRARERAALSGGERDHLTRYVKDYLARTGESARGLARRSRDPVTTISLRHGWINEIVNGERELPPDLPRLRALAAGMGVPVEVVAELAAAQWLGVDVAQVAPGGDGGETRVTVTVPPGLTPEERARFVRVAEDLAKHFGESKGA